MIVEALLNLVHWLLSLLLTPLHIPELPSGVAAVLSSGLTYLLDGVAIFAALTHYQYILALFSAVLVIQAAMLLYKFIRWLLQKLPVSVE